MYHRVFYIHDYSRWAIVMAWHPPIPANVAKDKRVVDRNIDGVIYR